MGILQDIIREKQKELAERKIKRTEEEVKSEILDNVFQKITADIQFENLDWEYSTGKKIPVRIEILSVKQHSDARLAARQKTLEKGIEEDTDVYYTEMSQELGIEIIKKAIKETKPNSDGKYPPAFIFEENIKSLTPTQIDSLLNLYEVARIKNSISEEVLLITDNFESWVKVISEAAEIDKKKHISLLSLADLVELNIMMCDILNRCAILTPEQYANTLVLNQEKLNQDIASSQSQQEDLLENLELEESAKKTKTKKRALKLLKEESKK